MLIRPAELEAIRSGDLDLAFRRWDRPRVRTGTHSDSPSPSAPVIGSRLAPAL